MSIRTYLDNNFFHSLHEWLEQDKELLKSAFLSQRYVLHSSIELFAELVDTLSSPDKRDRLPGKVALLLQLMESGRILNYSGTLVKDELMQIRHDPFLDAGRVEELRVFLREISAGGVPLAIPPFLIYIHRKKEQDRIQWQVIVNLLRQHYEAEYGRLSRRDSSFEQFYSDFPEKLFTGWLRRNGSEMEPVSLQAKDIVRRLQWCPHANAIARSVGAWIYLNVFVHPSRHIKYPDSFDIQQLVYLVDIDLSVSGDRNLAEACDLVYGNKVRIVTPETFFAELRNVMSQQFILRQAQDERVSSG